MEISVRNTNRDFLHVDHHEMLATWKVSCHTSFVITNGVLVEHAHESYIKRSLLTYRYLKGWGSVFIDIHVESKKRRLKRISSIYNIDFASMLSHSDIWKYIVMSYL
jgi:hypothetical protein